MLSYNDVFNELQNYILDDENIEKSIRMKICNTKNTKPILKEIETKKTLSIFVPTQQDSLFWCFFIMSNGDLKYETLNNKNSLIAKQMKIDLVQKIRKNKQVIKTYKLDTLSNIENNLANDNNINAKTFLSLCVVENINIIFVSKKTYYELLMNDSDIIYIVSEIQTQNKYNNKYGFEKANEKSIDTIRNSLFKINNIDKPVQSISSYKVQDLIDICSKLVIETTNKDTGKIKSKNDLYESLIQYF